MNENDFCEKNRIYKNGNNVSHMGLMTTAFLNVSQQNENAENQTLQIANITVKQNDLDVQ